VLLILEELAAVAVKGYGWCGLKSGGKAAAQAAAVAAAGALRSHGESAAAVVESPELCDSLVLWCCGAVEKESFLALLRHW